MLQEVKYNGDNRKENVYSNTILFRHIQPNRQRQKFFVKPQIKINWLRKNQSTVTMKAHGFNSMDFVINIWTLRIENIDKKVRNSRLAFIKKISMLSKLENKSLSRDVSDCSITFNITEGHQAKYRTPLPLFWARNTWPNECESGTLTNEEKSSEDKRTEYIGKLPSCYRGILLGNPESMDLYKNIHNDIILFFTFEESDSLYFVSRLNNELQNEDFSNLMFPIGKNIDLKINFQSQHPSHSEQALFRVIPSTWDEISIQKIT